MLPSHPDRLKVPGVDMTTGSLGQGCSVAAGLALDIANRHSEQYVFVIIGDGELNEGQNWEAFQFLAHHNLSQCIVIIDENKRQLDGYTKDILDPRDLKSKMEAFGFSTQRVKGDDRLAIDQAISKAKTVKDQVSCVILDSIKGQGVPYFAQLPANHSVRFGEQENAIVDSAIAELEKELGEQDV